MLTPADTTIRIYKQEGGEWNDWQQDYGLEDFAGCLPAVGDIILEPGVLQGLDRHNPANRILLKVVQRVFNPRDIPHYVVLVVEAHVPTGPERTLISPR